VPSSASTVVRRAAGGDDLGYGLKLDLSRPLQGFGDESRLRPALTFDAQLHPVAAAAVLNDGAGGTDAVGTGIHDFKFVDAKEVALSIGANDAQLILRRGTVNERDSSVL